MCGKSQCWRTLQATRFELNPHKKTKVVDLDPKAVTPVRNRIVLLIIYEVIENRAAYSVRAGGTVWLRTSRYARMERRFDVKSYARHGFRCV